MLMNSQIRCFALLQLFALAAGGGFLAAELARDAHEQATLTEKEAADVHQHQQQKNSRHTEPHHRAEAQAAEQGVC